MALFSVIRIESVLSIGSQRVGIEEFTAVYAHTVYHTVVKRTLQTVYIFTIAMQEEHAIVQIHHGDGSASLIIGSKVRQFVIIAVSLATMTCTYTTGQIVFLAHDIVPDGIYRLDVTTVTRQCCHISHAGIHIACTYSMAYRLFLFRYRYLTL